MTNIICPACGSENLKKVSLESSGQITLGPGFSFTERFHRCNVCGEEGDFSHEGDKIYLKAYNEALTNSVNHMVVNLSEKHGFSMSHFERAFELPARTLTRWKGGEFSATGVALLRIVTTYPWLVQVAESGFNESDAKSTLLNAGIKLFCEHAEEHGFTYRTISVEASPSFFVTTAEFKKPLPPILEIIGE